MLVGLGQKPDNSEKEFKMNSQIKWMDSCSTDCLFSLVFEEQELTLFKNYKFDEQLNF